MLKTREQAQNGVAYAKLHFTKSRPKYCFSSPKNEILNQPIRNLLISIS